MRDPNQIRFENMLREDDGLEPLPESDSEEVESHQDTLPSSGCHPMPSSGFDFFSTDSPWDQFFNMDSHQPDPQLQDAEFIARCERPEETLPLKKLSVDSCSSASGHIEPHHTSPKNASAANSDTSQSPISDQARNPEPTGCDPVSAHCHHASALTGCTLAGCSASKAVSSHGKPVPTDGDETDEDDAQEHRRQKRQALLAHEKHQRSPEQLLGTKNKRLLLPGGPERMLQSVPGRDFRLVENWAEVENAVSKPVRAHWEQTQKLCRPMEESENRLLIGSMVLDHDTDLAGKSASRSAKSKEAHAKWAKEYKTDKDAEKKRKWETSLIQTEKGHLESGFLDLSCYAGQDVPQ